jgi:putative ABC transport system permease protein
MFSFPLVKGNVDKVLKDPYSIVLTESLARPCSPVPIPWAG